MASRMLQGGILQSAVHQLCPPCVPIPADSRGQCPKQPLTNYASLGTTSDAIILQAPLNLVGDVAYEGTGEAPEIHKAEKPTTEEASAPCFHRRTPTPWLGL